MQPAAGLLLHIAILHPLVIPSESIMCAILIPPLIQSRHHALEPLSASIFFQPDAPDYRNASQSSEHRLSSIDYRTIEYRVQLVLVSDLPCGTRVLLLPNYIFELMHIQLNATYLLMCIYIRACSRF